MHYKLLHGDNREQLKHLADNSIDSIVCDPPYELGFMGKRWDSTGIAYDLTVWAECLRVLKPGGHLIAFGGTRTYHRMTVAIEDAGFEIRDCIMWLYGSGFPKSHDVSKALDKQAGAEREKEWKRYTPNSMAGAYDQRPWLDDARKNGGRLIDVNTPATDLAKQWHGWGTAAKPAHEPAILAYKPHDTEHGIIIANLQRLEAQLWLIQFVCSAEWNSTSSLSELSAVLSIAQWTADELISTKEDLCVQMDTSQLSEVMTTCLSIVQSWKHTWEEASIAGSTFITATVLSPIIGWTTLRSSASHLTPNSITKAVMEHGTTWQRALSAALPFVVASEKLRSTLELIAVEHAISETYNPADIDKRTAVEPAVLARKPLIGTVADNVTTWGVGGINVDGCRVGDEILPEQKAGQAQLGTFIRHDMTTPERTGRWPANVILDGDAGEALDEQSHSESSRFFYTAKASKAEREAGLEGMETKRSIMDNQTKAELKRGNVDYKVAAGKLQMGAQQPRANHHPTVKPIALMRYLIRLVTPKNGTVLDPFMGSGSTGCAAMCEGVNFVGIELSEEYLEIARRRIEYWQSQNPMGL